MSLDGTTESKVIVDTLETALKFIHQAKMKLQQFSLLSEDLSDASKFVDDLKLTIQSLVGMIEEEQRRIDNE